MFAPKPRHLLCLSLCLPLTSALACGPYFPMRLLSDRAYSLAQLPEGSFILEVSRLGPAIDGLQPLTDALVSQSYQKTKAENAGLSPEQAGLLVQLRELSDAHEAERRGATLPREINLYTAGAVAFNAGDYTLAAEYFRQVLALPAAQRAQRSTWAAYSLGRSLYALGLDASELDDAARQASLLQARQAFQQARQLSIEGFSDPLALGIASLGEEARLVKMDGDWQRAIELYASQSRLGSDTGTSSLRELAAELASLPDEQLQGLLSHSAVPRLLAAVMIGYLDNSSGETTDSNKKIISLLSNSPQASLDNADRLAALNYQMGDYANTQRLLEKAGDSGLAWWLRAKLAVRAGDKQAAAEAYAKASKAFPRDEQWGERTDGEGYYETLKPGCRVDGENALLALDRGDYLQAFQLLYRSEGIYWQDAAMVAERVLSLDELKQFVDEQVPAPPYTPPKADDYYSTLPVAAQLRELLGRRLLREGRYAEAPGYFASPELQAAAKAYGDYREQAESAWLPSRRAEGYYQAGLLARRSGMEILGYEMGPDYHSLSGSYSLEISEPVAGPWIGADEVQRQQATRAEPDVRYHYRYVAGTLANQAADLLPHTSQAFAAVLCKAARWTRGSDVESAAYQRYVENGPFVQWAENFGNECEDPDFSGANKRYLTQFVGDLRQTLAPIKGPLLAGGALVLLAGGGALWWRRRSGRGVAP
ncbi:hypothetical protein BK634_02840 [Pseudomonas chlororaphis]|nr:hypothetical protein BK634_02840 [Pseudomonas chlororaphis]